MRMPMRLLCCELERSWSGVDGPCRLGGADMALGCTVVVV